MNKDSIGETTWEILFGESLESIPDPNLPENVPHIAALKKQKIDSLRQFVEGPGRVFFDQIRHDVRMGMFEIFHLARDFDCSCKICVRIRELETYLKIIVKAQSIIKE